ncbi:pyridoxamine 5'-phosphate oxidase family protein [Rhodobacteraceae bacterium HSP-20]|uniref:Pyridoxamine 5'-phosphate oxidase family protein n=1 Tax=Paragemmobacter amnigenus TaxID=2852097 RepID=A0ABS6J8B0_9RHOB|nr:pyridoxamine 5'-phosphate oxidase family protein [Rhodobacter amnigenus]MBU9699828.1 pyridoxamine 5'-phosphate oxidase family protein [Rhodobacter amnigenus]MBV4391055.1 pyridoxamine 5'-phosphate oxidase family protein [Rhodobacter amnigenus]
MTTRPDPVAAPDDEARALARRLIDGATHAALAVTDPADGTPGISRIAFGRGPDGALLTLVSALAPHHAALHAHPACALLLGEAGEKGDPLTHPRLMVKARAEFIAPDDPARPAIRDHWLAHHPKAKLYIDFADFAFVRFAPVSALLNGGFARAFRLAPEDLR